MTELKYIEPMSLAKMSLIINCFLGIVTDAISIVISVVSPTFTGFTISTILYLLAIPAIYTISGFVMGFAIAFLYNFIAKKIGGVELGFK